RRLIDATGRAWLDLQRADAGLAGGEEIDHVLDVELRLVVQDAIEEGRRTAERRPPLILLGGILDALTQTSDDVGQIDARERATFGQRRELVDERQGVGLAHVTSKHLPLLLAVKAQSTSWERRPPATRRATYEVHPPSRRKCASRGEENGARPND